MSSSPTAKPSTQRVHDILSQPSSSLDVFFTPRSVALIGASETAGSVGRTILRNLITTPFGGTVYPINPKRPNVLGLKAYPKIKDVPETVDLAVICTPAATVTDLVSECGEAGVKGIIIISAGFKEMGPEGQEREQKILAIARKYGMRIVGPNCLGMMSPVSGLNASFAHQLAMPGKIAFISQSGALLCAILDWSLREKVGFSCCVSIGSMLDVNWGDLIDHLGNDPKTSAILIYMESIGDARSFMSAAREVALTKPIIVIKPGRTEQAAKAAASHTGSLTGGDDVIEAAFRRCGVLRVNNISDLFYTAEVLARQPRPKGPRLSIITNAGGPGVLATDALITTGGQLTEISEQTIQALNGLLPASWSHGNPIDVLGDAGADRYAKTLQLAADDPNSDGMLVILTPQDMTQPTQTAELLKQYTQPDKQLGKPILASWMGGSVVAAGDEILNQAGIPTFSFPDTAARMFTYLWRYAYNLKGLYETPSMLQQDSHPIDREAAEKIISTARNAGRNLLTEFESKALLAAYGIPTVQTVIATDAEGAVKAAEGMGYPVVLKLHSETITHKTDVGGVILNLGDAKAVDRAFNSIKQSVTKIAGAQHFNGVTVQQMVKLSDAYEVILGSSPDPDFGPVLLFGMGGQLVEVFKDKSLALPPLNATLARRMMEQTKIYTALKGVRGRAPVDLAKMEQILVRFSQLVVEQRWIKEIDINPLSVSANHIIALDGRVVLHDKSVSEDQLPRLSIRPYPLQYVRPWTTKDATALTIRPITPEDEPLISAFHHQLSEQSVRQRYFGVIKLEQRVAHDRLIRVCFNDYTRELALVVDHENHQTGKHEIVGVGRLSRIPHTTEAEFAIVVADHMQKKGIGSELARCMLSAAKAERITGLRADVLRENEGMQKILKRNGFVFKDNLNEPTLTAKVKID
jgi:acetyltransferase